MRRARLGFLLGVVVAVGFVGACALDESGTAGDGGVVPDVVVIDGGPDGDADAAEDVTYDVPDLGVGETESGLPCTCVSSVPSGYTVVEYVSNQQPGCSAGYDASTDYFENPQAGASSCQCKCGATPATPPTCACGGNPATFMISSGNGNCTDLTGESLLANTGSCYTTSQSLVPNGNKLNDMLAAPAAGCNPAGGACGAGVASQNFPTPTVDKARTCSLDAPTGSCTNGTCVPSPSSAYSLCITNFTVGSCAAFTDFPVPHLVGTSVQDNRSCAGNCSCSLVDAGSCGTPTLDLWNTSTSCNGTPDESLPADNSTCTPVGFGNGQTFGSTRYSVPHNGGACGFTGSYTPQGGVVLGNRFTICCHS